MISLTALVLTYNEQENIRRALEALVWVPKVIVVDSFSNDRTLEIARSFPNVQVVQRVFDTHANQWNAGLDRIDTEWALTLDADYVLTAELQEEGRAELNRLDKMRRWLIIVPLAMPIYLLLVRGLIFDGWNGWYYAFQRTVAEMMLSLRLLEAKLRG